MGTRMLNGVVVSSSTQEQAVIDAIQTISLAEIKQQILSLKKEKENGGITFNGVPIATDAEAIGDVLGGLGQAGTILTDSGHRLPVNETAVAAIKSAIEDYRFKVKQRAAVLDEAAEASSDLASFDVNAGWPTTVYPLS